MLEGPEGDELLDHKTMWTTICRELAELMTVGVTVEGDNLVDRCT